ncbi:MAG: MFS transporter [Asgard group archaeon]|nr:MFS transporter [Asgard group archaeon]
MHEEVEIKPIISEDRTLSDDNEKNIPFKTKLKIYIISAFSTSATFIARTFIDLYAVFINSSTTALSIITASRNLIQQAVQLTLGRLSDRFGRKLLMFIGLLVSGISLALFPIIENQWVLVVGVIVYSIGFATYTPAFTALQGDITSRENRAGLISLINIFGGFASLIGLIIVGFLGDTGGNEKIEYLIILEITAGIFIITAAISLFFTNPPTKKLEKKTYFTLKPLKENLTFRRFVILNSIMSFSMSLGWPLFPIVRKYFATNLENTWMWAVFCIFQIIALFATKPLINRIKRKWLLFIGRVGLFYVPINMAITIFWAQTWWHMAISSAISGFCNAFYFVGQSSYILDCAPEAEKGTYTGIHNLFIGIVTFIGSLIMGIIADYILIVNNEWFTLFVLLMIVAVIRIISSVTFLFLKEPIQS